MKYAEYILIGQMSNLIREIELLETKGNMVIKEMPESLRYTEGELDKIINDLKGNYQSLLDALTLIRAK